MFQLELQTSKVLASEMIITEIQVTKTEIIWLGNYQGDDHDHHDHHISCQCMQILQKHPRMTQPPIILCYIVVSIVSIALHCGLHYVALCCIVVFLLLQFQSSPQQLVLKIGVKVAARTVQVTCRLRVETRFVCHPNFSIQSNLIEIQGRGRG